MSGAPTQQSAEEFRARIRRYLLALAVTHAALACVGSNVPSIAASIVGATALLASAVASTVALHRRPRQ